MPSKYSYLLPGLLLAASTGVFADDPVVTTVPTDNSNNSNIANDTSNLTMYLKNMGKYFGYDLTQYCDSGGACNNNNSGSGSSSSTPDFSNLLLDPTITSLAQLNLFNNYLGSLVGASSNMPLIPNGSNYSQMNSTLAGQSFAYQNYSNASADTVSVSPIIDQPPPQSFQNDPVSQAVLNILSTPDYSYCQQNSSAPSCQAPFFREQILINAAGPLQQMATDVVFTPQQNAPFIPQLNIDSLLTPLMYSPATVSSSGSGNSKTPTLGDLNPSTGFTTDNATQAQNAANFIRYVTSSINPLPLPTRATYAQLYNTALGSGTGSKPTPAQASAQVQLVTYLMQLRTYAAQSSVAISNLYSALSRRLPQNNSSVVSKETQAASGNSAGDNNQPSSEAMDEFIMASWRLYNPNANGEQWLTKINKASPATVQKEMVVLLAEINYQMYLSRQQQERMLITQSMLLLQSGQVNPLSPTMINGSSNSSTTASDPTATNSTATMQQ